MPTQSRGHGTQIRVVLSTQRLTARVLCVSRFPRETQRRRMRAPRSIFPSPALNQRGVGEVSEELSYEYNTERTTRLQDHFDDSSGSQPHKMDSEKSIPGPPS